MGGVRARAKARPRVRVRARVGLEHWAMVYLVRAQSQGVRVGGGVRARAKARPRPRVRVRVRGGVRALGDVVPLSLGLGLGLGLGSGLERHRDVVPLGGLQIGRSGDAEQDLVRVRDRVLLGLELGQS